MGKGKRLRSQHKSEMIFKHMKTMQQREAFRQAFAMKPLAIAVKNICRNWGKTNEI